MIIFRRVSGGYLVKVHPDVPAVFVCERAAAIEFAKRLIESAPYVLNR